jgi:hypothetical protein
MMWIRTHTLEPPDSSVQRWSRCSRRRRDSIRMGWRGAGARRPRRACHSCTRFVSVQTHSINVLNSRTGTRAEDTWSVPRRPLSPLQCRSRHSWSEPAAPHNGANDAPALTRESRRTSTAVVRQSSVEWHRSRWFQSCRRQRDSNRPQAVMCSRIELHKATDFTIEIAQEQLKPRDD